MEGPLEAGGGRDIAHRLVKSLRCWRVRCPDRTLAGHQHTARFCRAQDGSSASGTALLSPPGGGIWCLARGRGTASKRFPIVRLCFCPLGLREPNCPWSAFPYACWQKATGFSGPLSRCPGEAQKPGDSPAWWPSVLKPSAAAPFPPLGVCLGSWLLSLSVLICVCGRGAGGGGRAGPGIKGTLYLIWSLTGYFQMQLKASNYSYGYY